MGNNDDDNIEDFDDFDDDFDFLDDEDNQSNSQKSNNVANASQPSAAVAKESLDLKKWFPLAFVGVLFIVVFLGGYTLYNKIFKPKIAKNTENAKTTTIAKSKPEVIQLETDTDNTKTDNKKNKETQKISDNKNTVNTAKLSEKENNKSTDISKDLTEEAEKPFEMAHDDLQNALSSLDKPDLDKTKEDQFANIHKELAKSTDNKVELNKDNNNNKHDLEMKKSLQDIAEDMTENVKELKQLQSTMQDLAKTLNSINQGLNSIDTRVVSLNESVNNISDDLNNVKKIIQEEDLDSDSNLAQEASSNNKGVKDYVVHAIIPGRAWLKSANGQIVTVTEGDSLGDFGKIAAIDAGNSVVRTSSGVSFR